MESALAEPIHLNTPAIVGADHTWEACKNRMAAIGHNQPFGHLLQFSVSRFCACRRLAADGTHLRLSSRLAYRRWSVGGNQ
jgi:hypothetical protein